MFQFMLSVPDLLFLYVDENGKIPRIYTQTKGTGHAFVTIGEGSNTIVYTYGRYGSLYGSSGITSGRFTPSGEGVLIKKTGKAAAKYLKDVAGEGEFYVYEIQNGDDEKTERYYDQELETGLSPSGGNKEIYSDSEVRVVDNYSLFKNNCVTKTLDGINAGKGKNILDDPAKAPKVLKNNLDIKSQTEKNIVKIEDPLKFVLSLIEIIQSHDK